MSTIQSYFSFCPHFFFPSKQENSCFEGISNVSELLEHLVSSSSNIEQWILKKKEIAQFIQQHQQEVEELDNFFETLMEKGEEEDPFKIMIFLKDLIELDVLNNVIRFKTEETEMPYNNILEWITDQVLIYPEPIHSSLGSQMMAEWGKVRHCVLHFIPNLINLFLGTFNFIDSHKKFKTLFEKSLVVDMLCKLFIFPYCLIKLLQPILGSTMKVHLVASAIIVSIGILITCYQRCFRPMPEEFPNCRNLDKQMETGQIHPKVGQILEIEQLIAALEADSNVILLGHSGDGKTALMHHFIQLKQEGKLSDKLQNLSIQEIDCGLMMSSVNYGASELINQTKDQIEGYEDKILFFFDEFYQIASNKDAFQIFKKRFLDEIPSSKFVAIMTFEEFKKVKELDVDGSFRRRVFPIIVQTASDEQVRLVLLGMVNRIAKNIYVTDDAIESILEISNSDDFLSNIGRIAKAIKLLNDAIGLARAAYNPHFISQELSEAKQKYQQLKMQVIHDVKGNPETLKEIKEMRNKITEYENKLNSYKKHIQKIQQLFVNQQKIQKECIHLTYQIGAIQHTEPTIPISEDIQKTYLMYYFYGIDAIKKKIESEISFVRESMPVQVDKDLIHHVYDEIRKVENGLYGEKIEEGNTQNTRSLEVIKITSKEE